MCPAREALARRVGPAPAVRGHHLAREADHAETVGPVERHLDLEHLVRRAEQLVERPADLGLGGAVEHPRQVEDALVLVRDLELARRAQHPLALLAADLALLDRHAAGSVAPTVASGGDHAGVDVRRPAHDAQLARAAVDAAERQPVGVGMAGDLEHPRHHDAGIGAAVALDALDVEAAQRQRLGDRLGASRRRRSSRAAGRVGAS